LFSFFYLNQNKIIFQGSASAEEHGCYVWEHFVRPSHAQHVCVMAHSYGGAVVLAMV
jgi:alpha-beta hydrolase superfamily lysophospholipase